MRSWQSLRCSSLVSIAASTTVDMLLRFVLQSQVFGYNQITSGGKLMLLTIPDGDHLTLMNKCFQPHAMCVSFPLQLQVLYDWFVGSPRWQKNWAWTNHLLLRRPRLSDHSCSVLSWSDQSSDLSMGRSCSWIFVESLICGFFMQVVHKEGENGNLPHYYRKRYSSKTWSFFYFCRFVWSRLLPYIPHVALTPNQNVLSLTSLY